MNERINNLRENSLSAEPVMSHQRAQLLTEFYQSQDAKGHSIPVMRALAFKYIMEHKKICVMRGELIVGERGEFPKSTPTYPEIVLHSLDDLEKLDKRKKQFFKVNEETRKIYREKIIPYWEGRTIRDKMFRELSDEWKEAYEAGVFTEFLEQRAPGHTVIGKDSFKKGFLDIKEEIALAISRLDFVNDPLALDKKEELIAMDISADAIMAFAQRHAKKIEMIMAEEKDDERLKELREMHQNCLNVPAHAPQTFWEALQHYWFIHQGVVTELNPWDSFNPGRLDQHLYPFYTREIENGTLTKERAKELLMAFWVKFNNHPAPPKMGVTLKESSTYTDFSLINVGGVKEDGSDAVNELSYLILDVIEEMRLLQPSSMVQLSKKNPDRFIKRALKIVKTGFGQPSIFNTDSIIQEMLRQGKRIEDARNGGASGCVETGAFGNESYILTGYFNIPKILELTLFNGVDPRTGKTLGLKTGNPSDFKSFEELMTAFERQLNHFIDIKIQGNNLIEQIWAKYLPAPFLSTLINDCIPNGKDYNAGGARYNTNYIQGVGLGSITDELTAIKYHIFDRKSFSFDTLIAALKANFDDYEEIEEMLLNHTPKFGNDDDYADDQTRRVFELYFKAIDSRPNTKGGVYRINLLPTTSHIYFGSVIGAMPDGRKAKEPLSEGISPVQGADRNGPTSVLKSAAKIDHLRTGGTLLNQKFTPSFLSDNRGITSVAQLIRTYFKMDGHHIQFNVVTAQTLRDAQAKPEKYRDLIVRVAGYSDYFVDLTEELQNEIIRRTEHENAV
ncbi:MAG: glycyl radical protein [Bacteroidales bacterium]|nr:glycyl radical protein [Bacteroidales bacterium]